MIHLGDITKIHGNQIEPVHCIIFGSPCQDLSMAGLRLGFGGDRSVLFVDAVRIIGEMRRATNGMYPTFAVWENVPYVLKRIRHIMSCKQLCKDPPSKFRKFFRY